MRSVKFLVDADMPRSSVALGLSGVLVLMVKMLEIEKKTFMMGIY